jgi:hypothetical protein
MVDDFNTALSTPLSEGFRRIMLVVSWGSFVIFSIAIVFCAVGLFYESGIQRPDKSDPFAMVQIVNPDGNKSNLGGDRIWSLSNMSPSVLCIIPGAVVAVAFCRWLSFKIFPGE